MEFVWRPSSALGNNVEILTHFLMDQYQSPPGLGFDILDSDQPQWNSSNGATEAL